MWIAGLGAAEQAWHNLVHVEASVEVILQHSAAGKRDRQIAVMMLF
jgi:hypothetical protein